MSQISSSLRFTILGWNALVPDPKPTTTFNRIRPRSINNRGPGFSQIFCIKIAHVPPDLSVIVQEKLPFVFATRFCSHPCRIFLMPKISTGNSSLLCWKLCSNRYIFQPSDKSLHTWSFNRDTNSSCCHSLVRMEVNTQAPCNAIISFRDPFGHEVQYASHLRLEYETVTTTDLHHHLASKIYSFLSIRSIRSMLSCSTFHQCLCLN